MQSLPAALAKSRLRPASSYAVEIGKYVSGASAIAIEMVLPSAPGYSFRFSSVNRDSSPTSSKPLAATPWATIAPIVVMDRSRTGLVIIPAWQNRQPRVQPRKISTLYRSCTVSATGTTGARGYGQASRSITVCFETVDGTQGRFGTTFEILPSGWYDTS